MNIVLCIGLLCAGAHGYAADMLQLYEQRCANNPDDYRALYNAGVVAFKENKLARAKECFDGVKDIATRIELGAAQAEQLFYNAGNTEIKLQKYEDAVKSFSRVLEYNAHNEKAREKLAYAQKMLEEHKKEEQKKDQQQDQNDQQNKDKENNQEKSGNQQEQEQSDQQQEQQKQDSGSENKKDNQHHDDKKDAENQQKTEKDQQKNQQPQKQKKEGSSAADQKKSNESEKQQGNKPDPQQQKTDGTKNQQPNEPPLTADEQNLLAAVQNLDQNMQGSFEQRKLKQARGAASAYNNW